MTSVSEKLSKVESKKEEYPGWDQKRHASLQGKIRFIGADGILFPAEILGDHWTDPRVRRQRCQGLNAANEEVWTYQEDTPLPGFVSLDARDAEEEQSGDDPIPYDYDLPPHADASSIQISNFDAGNPVGADTRVPHDEQDLAEKMEAFHAGLANDPNKPAGS